jgi:hypothetical protein
MGLPRTFARPSRPDPAEKAVKIGPSFVVNGKSANSHRASTRFRQCRSTYLAEISGFARLRPSRRIKVKSPQTNGIVERFHRTVLNEFYRVAFRRKIYSTTEELQRDLDLWLKEYNEVRPHQGRWCYGKTPLQTFIDVGHRLHVTRCWTARRRGWREDWLHSMPGCASATGRAPTAFDTL